MYLGLTDVHLPAGAWYFVDDIRLFVDRKMIFYLCEEVTEGGCGLEYCSDVEVLTHHPYLLTDACYIWLPEASLLRIVAGLLVALRLNARRLEDDHS